jgi:PPOX class probable F420-dependent enzyme
MDDKLRALREERVRDFLKLARVARFATSDHSGIPHNIPICFWFDETARFYFVIDEKPKRLTGAGLKRMRNLAENPQVALIIDHYEEDWSCLAYVLIHGQAHVVEDPNDYMLALRNLRDKYLQYRALMLSFEKNPMIRIEVEHVQAWGERFRTSEPA